MAFEIKDWFHSYTNRGGIDGLFNVVREDSENDGLKYYAWQNENGAYVIMRQRTVTTTAIEKVYEYYATKKVGDFTTDWASRAGLSYQEYYQIFTQNT